MEPRSEANEPRGKRPPRLLVVGRVLPHKRLEVPIAVHGLLQRTCDSDAELDIVGDNTLCPDYVKELQCGERNPSFPPPRWWGKVSFQVLSERYRQANVMLFASSHEGFGVPLLEAMTLGLPVIAAHCEGVVETLGPAGLVVRGEHLAGMTELAAMVLEDPELRRRLIAIGRERAEHFAQETLIERLRPVWEAWG
jgi:glycosyltransferase involved in cell wall biosynthesis